MANTLFVGFMGEGITDHRFLIPIIEKILIELAYECHGQIDTKLIEIPCNKESFVEMVLCACKKGFEEYAISIMIVQTDADDITNNNAYKYKINPAVEAVNKYEGEICRLFIPLVPIFETESWMLADKEILRKQIGTTKTDAQLGISGSPESLRNPKEKIEEAIRIGQEDLPKKLKNKLKISHLYSILGQSIEVEKLESFKSYQLLKANLRECLRSLNLIQ